MTESKRGDRRREAERQAQQGPAREDQFAEQEALRSNPRDEQSYQTQPETERPVRSREPETGTADRAERAAGLEPENQHFQSSERAFEESRGNRTPRTRDAENPDGARRPRK